MKQKIQISIPEPCQEGWQNMTPVEKGRFCASCQKTVLDFTHLSDNEIINLVAKNDTLCGRINVSQLNRNLIETKTKSNYFGYFATSILAFLGLGTESSVAQEKPAQEQTDLKHLNKIIDSDKKITVTGVVTSEGVPLPGVTVRIKNKKEFVQTDEFGRYSIKVKKGKILVFSYIGLEDMEVKVVCSTVNATLHDGETFIGTVVID
ncbi:carboxypeptidase-like regulatory domain-containing protein [Flavobacterium facile]|uniref:carboxypeptidase-like regulatory domain-containing protein n=1 Tax=Flavobacterium facile TaxID=2893174 RepID=UPI002E7663BD|nr:carboxypeptidase-like regulatory domain-containing protein [Flavobacterium sp. T-12]